MMLDQIEKQRAVLLSCEHPFLNEARLTEQTLCKKRAEYLEVKNHMKNNSELASHVFIKASYAEDKTE